MSYNTDLQSKNARIQALIDKANTLPEAGGGLPDSVSALASGTITPASDTSNPTITHNLGVKPDFAFLILGKAADTWVDGSMAIWSSLICRPAKLPDGTEYQAFGYKFGISATGALSGYQANDTTGDSYPVTTETIKIPTPNYLTAGYTYYWVCGVFN